MAEQVKKEEYSKPSSVDKLPERVKLDVPSYTWGRVRIARLLDCADSKELIGTVITVSGWSKTIRKQGGGEFCFIALHDGTSINTLQVVVNKGVDSYDELLTCGVSCSFTITGTIVESPAEGQEVELKVDDMEKGHKLVIHGKADQTSFPLAKKQHSKEFLRETLHIRPRSYFQCAVTRIRSQLSIAVHRFFSDRGFLYIHTPIITSSDCEGAGEMFQVTHLLPRSGLCKSDEIPIKGPSKALDYSKDFFGKPAYLTVSGQLAVEPYCCSLGDVYTFGPTFRAEESHTSRHLAEFWMIEPEMAFCSIYDIMANGEAVIKYCVNWCLDNCMPELLFLQKTQEEGLVERLKLVVAEDFVRISYTEAVDMLKVDQKSGGYDEVEWGDDLKSEHERYLVEKVFKKPVIVYNYPASIKSFYMKLNEDGKTVQALDMLVPKIGEIIGGSQREEDYAKLEANILKKQLKVEDYSWYLDLRKYGTVPHGGYGLGFERLVMLVTGVENIRDVIPYPRYPGSANC